MDTAIFTEKKSEHQHHIIHSHHTGYRVCDECGETFGRIYDVGTEFDTKSGYFYSLLAKYKEDKVICENLYLISDVKSNLELSAEIFKNSLYLFKQTVENIEIKKESKRLYALSCIYYSLKESNCSVLCREILEMCYGNVSKDILKKFYDAYYDLTEKLELKKLILSPDHFLDLLFIKFKMDKEKENSAKLILSKIMKFSPSRKQMNSGIAAGVFYINSKVYGLNISQKQIMDALKISKSAVWEYTKYVSLILSSMYCEENNYKLKNKDLKQLKQNIDMIIISK